MSFTGFGPDTFDFLRDLRDNNSTDWFKAKENQKRYKASVVAPSKAFVAALGEELGPELGDFNAVPSGNGSLGRINRDIRFSKDKTPYNSHLAFHFWLGGGSKKESAGFRVWMGIDGLSVGAGARGLPDLDAFRAAVADADRGAALEQAIADCAANGFDLHGEQYKRVPKPYAKDHARADLLRYKSIYAGDNTPHPDSIGTPEFVGYVADRLRGCTPLARWLQALLA